VEAGERAGVMVVAMAVVGSEAARVVGTAGADGESVAREAEETAEAMEGVGRVAEDLAGEMVAGATAAAETAVVATAEVEELGVETEVAETVAAPPAVAVAVGGSGRPEAGQEAVVMEAELVVRVAERAAVLVAVMEVAARGVVRVEETAVVARAAVRVEETAVVARAAVQVDCEAVVAVSMAAGRAAVRVEETAVVARAAVQVDCEAVVAVSMAAGMAAAGTVAEDSEDNWVALRAMVETAVAAKEAGPWAGAAEISEAQAERAEPKVAVGSAVVVTVAEDLVVEVMAVVVTVEVVGWAEDWVGAMGAAGLAEVSVAAGSAVAGSVVEASVVGQKVG